MKKTISICLALIMMFTFCVFQVSAEENGLIFPVSETTGTWGESKAVKNYDGNAHLWSSDGKATFKIDLKVPNAGKYELFFWKCVHEKSTDSMEILFTQGGNTNSIATLNLKTGETGWTSLGIYEFDGSEAYLSGTVKPNYRLGAAMLVPSDGTPVVLPETKPEQPTQPEPETKKEPVVRGEKITVDPNAVDNSVYANVPNENYVLVFADEFEGDALNENVWNYRTGERLGGMNRPENVEIKDGKLVQNIYFDTIDGKEMITGGGIISKDLFGYGYYETRCRLFSETGGVHSSFWSMGRTGDGVVYPKNNLVYELDGYEIDSDMPYDITCNAVQKIGEHKSFAFQPIRDYLTSQEFTFAYEWLPNEINWYLNGKLIQHKTRDDIVFHNAQQNVWITGLANVDLSNTIEIDKSKFPADVTWDYFRFFAAPMKNINLVSGYEFEFNENPDFGQGTGREDPVCWMEIGDADASNVEDNNNAVGGNNVLAHRSDKDYKVTTAQRLYYIANGNYNFEVFAMSSGGQKTAKVRLSGFNGETVLEKDIPASDKMVKLSFENIEVTDNELYIEFISDATKDQWMLIDDPNFYCTTGWETEPARRYSMDVSDVSFGEIAAYNGEPKDPVVNAVLEGPWKKSSQPGYNGLKTQYANEFDNETASATYTMTAEKDAEYDVLYYNVGHPKSGTGVHIWYEHNGQKVDKTVDTSGARGWIKLGRVSAKAGDKITVTIDTEYGGLVRASAAAIVDDSGITLRDALILRLDNNKAFKRGIKVSVDESNPDVYPKLLNDRTMVPIRFIAEALGATVGYDEATRGITITLGDTTVTLQIGSDQMLINGTPYTLDAPAYEENGRTLVPVRAVSEGLNQKVTFVPNEFVIIGDKTYQPSDELFNNMIYIFD
ncbi:MAG: family 16 glycosylhydrolase [Clostridia bacterium]|nr:family 16 glycosylhydrolase [Clostridia bacterium]